MRISSSIQIKASPERIFALYSDVEKWARWDPEVKSAFLDQGLRVGSTGWLCPRKGPRAAIKVTGVVDLRSFTVESRLPLCRMVFGHEIELREDHAAVTHWAEFSGLLSFLFRRLVGSQIRRSLPGTMSGLKQMAEAE